MKQMVQHSGRHGQLQILEYQKCAYKPCHSYFIVFAFLVDPNENLKLTQTKNTFIFT